MLSLSLAEMLPDNVVEGLANLADDDFAREEEVHPKLEGLFVEEGFEEDEEIRFERSLHRLAEAWWAAVNGNKGARELFSLAFEGRESALVALLAFTPDELARLGERDISWMEDFCGNLSDEDKEMFLDGLDWEKTIPKVLRAFKGRLTDVTRSKAEQAVWAEASVGAFRPEDTTKWWCPVPLNKGTKRKIAVRVATEAITPGRLYDALLAGDLYRKTREAMEMGLVEAVKIAEGDGLMAESLGALGRFQKDLPETWRKWLTSRFPEPDLPRDLVKKVVYNACEDTPRWRKALRFRAEVEAAAAEIYLAVFHRCGPLLGQAPETWNKAEKFAAGIVGHNDRRIPEKVANRLKSASIITKDKAQKAEFHKVRVFTLPARDKRGLEKARLIALTRVAELRRWKGGDRKRWKLAAEATKLH